MQKCVDYSGLFSSANPGLSAVQLEEYNQKSKTLQHTVEGYPQKKKMIGLLGFSENPEKRSS